MLPEEEKTELLRIQLIEGACSTAFSSQSRRQELGSDRHVQKAFRLPTYLCFAASRPSQKLQCSPLGKKRFRRMEPFKGDDFL